MTASADPATRVGYPGEARRPLVRRNIRGLPAGITLRSPLRMSARAAG